MDSGRRYIVVAASLLLGVACSGSTEDESGVGAEADSAFCQTLLSEIGKIGASAQNADGTNDEFVTALENLAEFTRMLRLLEEDAPGAISTDMSVVVDAWDAQAAALSEVASDPFGAIATQLMTSLMSSASFQAVDDYALTNCGTQIFGTVGVPLDEETPVGTTSGGTYSQSSAAFTDVDGWNYEFSPNVGDPVVSVTKDITNSPPGKAQLLISVQIGDGFPGSLRGTDVGRNAPSVSFGDTDMVWLDFPAELGGDDELRLTLADGSGLAFGPATWTSSVLDETVVDEVLSSGDVGTPTGLLIEVFYDFNINPLAGPMAAITMLADGSEPSVKVL